MDTMKQFETAATLLADDTFDRDCPMRAVMDQVTTRWSTLILAALVQEPLRFNALQARVGGVSSKMLAQNLKSLERSGLINREVQASVPPRVTYSLTGLGVDLAEPLCSLIAWFGNHASQIQTAQSQFDARPRSGDNSPNSPSSVMTGMRVTKRNGKRKAR